MNRKIVNLSDYRKALSSRAYRAGRPTNPLRELFIRNEARNLLIKAWLKERGDRGRKVELAEILPIEPRWVLRQFPGWTFEEPEEIGRSVREVKLGREIAGVLDRRIKRIEVAGSLPAQVRRFTGGHELGHLALHLDLLHLRESPLSDEGIRGRKISPIEDEANIFAAELLMPGKLVGELFDRIFGKVVDANSISDDEAFYWTNGAIPATELRKKAPVDLAMVLADSSPFTTTDSRSLTEIFGVSTIAMAIQLVDLALVAKARAKQTAPRE
jgi:hypothetical protein